MRDHISIPLATITGIGRPLGTMTEWQRWWGIACFGCQRNPCRSWKRKCLLDIRLALVEDVSGEWVGRESCLAYQPCKVMGETEK